MMDLQKKQPPNHETVKYLEFKLNSLQHRYNYCDRTERFDLQQEIDSIKKQLTEARSASL
jgi:hypothetical protein